MTGICGHGVFPLFRKEVSLVFVEFRSAGEAVHLQEVEHGLSVFLVREDESAVAHDTLADGDDYGCARGRSDDLAVGRENDGPAGEILVGEVTCSVSPFSITVGLGVVTWVLERKWKFPESFPKR